MPPHRRRAAVWGLTAAVGALLAATPARAIESSDVERVTTAAPFPRGLVMKDGKLYVLCRGRVRGSGGVSAAVDDQAGTIYVVDPERTEPIDRPPSEVTRNNGAVFARPTDPPFNLWDRTADPPERDRQTDRPYCTLRYHAPTHSFYLCAFSGIDMPRRPEHPSFSKNLADALLRYDTRTGRWYDVERHHLHAGGSYPHHDPAHADPPHGWLNGPDNCLPLGNKLYAVAKDNSVLARYDLSALADDPEAGHPPGEVLINENIWVEGLGQTRYYGQSGLAYHDGWLYISYRTSSVILRVRLDDRYQLRQPVKAQLVARFDPYDPSTGTSADLTDLDIDDKGRLYVVSAQPSRVYRFTPDPDHVFDGRTGQQPAWADMAALTDNPNMKSENVMVHGNWAYVTSGDGYGYQKGADGTVYRVRIGD